jgi:cysteinyl-tRNA synthetase
MSLRYLGKQLDIHGGGQDLIFPHHENEIAQSESCTGAVPFVRYWLHNGLLQLGGEKMSKSLGNLLTIRQILDDYDSDALRLFILSSHYRRPLTFTEDSLPSAQKGIERLRTVFRDLTAPDPGNENSAITDALLSAAHDTKAAFLEAMDDDFNTAEAIGQMFGLVREINRAREQGASAGSLIEARDILAELAGVLGFRTEQPEGQAKSTVEVAPFIDLLISVRKGLRERKQWDLADEVRNQLTALGVVLEDRPDGTVWRLERR